jgi:hypothetical protein
MVSLGGNEVMADLVLLHAGAQGGEEGAVANDRGDRYG